MIPLKRNYFLKVLSPNTVTLGIRASTYKFWGTKFSSYHTLTTKIE